MTPSAVSSIDTTEAELDLARAGEPGAVPAEREPIPLAVRSRSVRSGDPGIAPGACPAGRARRAYRARRRSNSAASAARSRTSSPATLSRRTWPVGVVSPRRYTLRRRISSGRMPSALGDAVELGLGRELDLRRAEAAERAVGRRVRARRPGPDPDVRAAVRAAGVDRAARQDDRGERAVRAAVHDDLDVLGDEPSVARDAGPVADDRRVALRRRGDVLVAVVDHPHRTAGLAAPAARRGAR